MDDTRRIFLDIDSLSRWDQATLFQRFPKAERVPITGIEPGPAGSWDARGADYPCVLYEDGLFRMWYSCMPDAENYGENADHAFVCYAESDDGVTWRKPDLKITGQNRYPGNNLLALPGFCMGVVRALPGSEFKYLAVSMQIIAPGTGHLGCARQLVRRRRQWPLFWRVPDWGGPWHRGRIRQ